MLVRILAAHYLLHCNIKMQFTEDEGGNFSIPLPSLRVKAEGKVPLYHDRGPAAPVSPRNASTRPRCAFRRGGGPFCTGTLHTRQLASPTGNANHQ